MNKYYIPLNIMNSTSADDVDATNNYENGIQSLTSLCSKALADRISKCTNEKRPILVDVDDDNYLFITIDKDYRIREYNVESTDVETAQMLAEAVANHAEENGIDCD